MPRVPSEAKAANGEAKKPRKQPDAKPQALTRPVVYDKIKVVICQGDHPLTAAKAKELLGWDDEHVTDQNYDLVDVYGKKVRLHNNTENRGFKPAVAKLWTSEILNKRWRLNGESMIIGKTGQTMSAQHRLAALVLAVQEWEKDKETWSLWESEPTIECLIALGVDESDDVANTIDTGAPRTFTDVLYRSAYFRSKPKKERGDLARIASHAVRLVRYRTWADRGAYSPSKVSHLDLTGFLDAHSKILDSVSHIHEENSDNKVSAFLLPGAAAGMLYLMAASDSDLDKYRNDPQERTLKLKRWDLAEEFFTLLAQGSPALAPVREALGTLLNEHGTVTFGERLALVALAWAKFSADEKIKPSDLKLEYVTTEEGGRTLAPGFCPVVGGIDLGEPGEEEEEHAAPTEAEAGEEQTASEPAKAEASAKWAPKVGDHVWVEEEDGDHWQGQVTELYGPRSARIAKVKIAGGFPRAGKIHEAPAAQLRKGKPQVSGVTA